MQQIKKKRFPSYYPKLHGAVLEPGTFEFVTNALTSYASTTHGFLSFYFAYTQRIESRLFSDILMYVIDIF